MDVAFAIKFSLLKFVGLSTLVQVVAVIAAIIGAVIVAVAVTNHRKQQ